MLNLRRKDNLKNISHYNIKGYKADTNNSRKVNHQKRNLKLKLNGGKVYLLHKIKNLRRNPLKRSNQNLNNLILENSALSVLTKRKRVLKVSNIHLNLEIHYTIKINKPLHKPFNREKDLITIRSQDIT